MAACNLAATLTVHDAAPAARSLSARVAPGVYHLGNVITLDIETPLNTPAFYLEGDLVAGADWGSARIAMVQAVPPSSFPGTLRIQAKIQVFATGTIHLPPLPLAVRTGDRKQAFKLTVPDFTVAALLPQGDQPEPPAAAPLPLPRPFPWGWIVLGVGLLAAAVFVILWLIRRKSQRPARAAAVPDLRATDPDRWIREELERLYRAPVEPHLRYGAISQRLRDYLEIKSGLPFLEWTTSEVQLGLREMTNLRSESPADLMGSCPCATGFASPGTSLKSAKRRRAGSGHCVLSSPQPLLRPPGRAPHDLLRLPATRMAVVTR